MNAENAAAPTIETVWKQVDEDLRRELIDLWTRDGAITDRSIAGVRAGQAVCVARDTDGILCGVATAVPRMFPRLRHPMFYYRQYFAPSIRGRGHATGFLNESRRVLADHVAARPDAKCLGVLVELENAHLASVYDRVHVPEVGMTFIGYSPRGLPIFASYFEGAKLRPGTLTR